MAMEPKDMTREELVRKVEALQALIERLEQENKDLKHNQPASQSLYLEAVVNSSPSAIITLDADYRITMCNAGAEALFGYTEEEMKGKNIDDLIAGEESLPEARCFTEQAVSGQEVHQTEAIRYRKDGTPVSVMLAGAPIIVENKLVGAVAVYTDIRPIKKMQHKIEKYSEELEAKIEELKQANEELSYYTYAVAHDLRAPLRALINYTRFFQEDCSDNLDELGQEYLQALSENARYMEQLIVDLLEYSRIGQTPIKTSEVNIKHLLALIIDEVKPAENAKIIIPNNLPIINTNELLLKQIFSNLIANALKFNQSEIPKVTIQYVEHTDRWEFSISDNGIGIENEYLERIFGMFQRLHTQEEYEGTGIGLAIVEKALKTLGGSIRVSSIPQEGSRFTFTIPKPDA